jgi:hypothetical protein
MPLRLQRGTHSHIPTSARGVERRTISEKERSSREGREKPEKMIVLLLVCLEVHTKSSVYVSSFDQVSICKRRKKEKRLQRSHFLRRHRKAWKFPWSSCPRVPESGSFPTDAFSMPNGGAHLMQTPTCCRRAARCGAQYVLLRQRTLRSSAQRKTSGPKLEPSGSFKNHIFQWSVDTTTELQDRRVNQRQPRTWSKFFLTAPRTRALSFTRRLVSARATRLNSQPGGYP